MSKEEQEQKIDPKEEITMAREELQRVLQASHDRGWSEGCKTKYIVIVKMLLKQIEVMCEAIKPVDASLNEFVHFLLQKVQEEADSIYSEVKRPGEEQSNCEDEDKSNKE